ncbi:uncharacterized protein LOC108043140 isoform X4 [Drosophila rhopaloa]|uniref:Uncharacterized protein n=1 Tax=Drosophila rhopaloa TaxID=1041015 RepID=A0ABM5JF17_DRORH|nr:uncharacterized protein LOC108043140 isoform X4 [Drosophila rhopaloa]
MFKILAKEPALLRRHIPVTFVYLSKWAAVQQFQLSDTMENYREAEPIPIPTNVDAAETTRFSHQRSRDISSTVITAQASISTIDITIDNSLNAVQEVFQDPHVQSYDCFGFISLNSAMQSNVPTPFGGFNKFSHLNMPGGQWSQENKFMAQNMHNSHYSALRDNARAEWATYDQNATVGSNCRGFDINVNFQFKKFYNNPMAVHDITIFTASTLTCTSNSRSFTTAQWLSTILQFLR